MLFWLKQPVKKFQSQLLNHHSAHGQFTSKVLELVGHFRNMARQCQVTDYANSSTVLHVVPWIIMADCNNMAPDLC